MNLPQPLQQVDRTYVHVNGRKLSYFAGCDYFRLASHPKVIRAAEIALKKFGLNVAASRLTTGNHELFGKLESALAHFFDADASVLVSNGYVTNLVVAQALAGEFSHVLIDEKVHPSLKDAALILGVSAITFRHRDVEDFKRSISTLPSSSRPILLTDGMFSHDGAIAPLKNYFKHLPKNAFCLLDDAHGAGTLGQTGKGVLELEGVSRKRVIQSITLSKAFGCYGGAILCSHDLRERIVVRSRMFVGNTPLPLPLANAAITAVQILKTDKSLRRRLKANVDYLWKGLAKAKFILQGPSNPILTIAPKSDVEAAKLKAICLKRRVFPSFIKYPGGPENGYFRFVVSSEHTKAQLNDLIAALSE